MGVLGDLWGDTTKILVHCGVRNKNFESQWRGQRKKNVPKDQYMGDRAMGAGGLAPPVFAKFVQNLPFLPQILAFPCLQPPHVPVSPLTFKFTPPSMQ